MATFEYPGELGELEGGFGDGLVEPAGLFGVQVREWVSSTRRCAPMAVRSQLSLAARLVGGGVDSSCTRAADSASTTQSAAAVIRRRRGNSIRAYQ
jgi:hypothetical protein